VVPVGLGHHAEPFDGDELRSTPSSHGTTALFAALEVATGRVTDACYPRHRHDKFLRFLKHVAKAYPRVKLHLVVDNYATHKHPAVQHWLARNPRITMHFTPTSGVLAEHGGDLLRDHHPTGHPPRQLHQRQDLIAAIETFIDGWNERCQPFVWTKTACATTHC
jgi:DDE superfamily endonuclease